MSEEAKADKRPKNRLSEEAARDQIQKLMDSYDIEVSDIVVDQGPEGMETIINRLVRGVRKGIIEVMDDGSVKHNLVAPKGEITYLIYSRFTGNAERERDKAKGNFEKNCAMMGSLAGVPGRFMADLDAVDRSIMSRLAVLFMIV